MTDPRVPRCQAEVFPARLPSHQCHHPAKGDSERCAQHADRDGAYMPRSIYDAPRAAYIERKR